MSSKIQKMNYKHIALVGTGDSRKGEEQHISPDVAVFTLSVCYNLDLPRRDAVLEMHPQRWLENKRYDPKILEHIEGVDCPVYMAEPYPWAQPFPFLEAVELSAGVLGRQYFTSSFDYLAALALLHNPDRIDVYRFDMATETEWAYQAPGASFWLGIAAGRRVEVDLGDSPLLTGLVYGYEGTRWITYERLLSFRDEVDAEARKAGAKANKLVASLNRNGRKRNQEKMLKKLGAARDEYSVRAGALAALEELLDRFTIDDMITRQELEKQRFMAFANQTRHLSRVNFWEGAAWERQQYGAPTQKQAEAQLNGVRARDDYFAWKGAVQVLDRLLDETDMRQTEGWKLTADTVQVNI